MVEWWITEIAKECGKFSIFFLSSGQAWILSLTWFEQNRVRAVGTGAMSSGLSVVRLCLRSGGLLPNGTLCLQQALPKQPRVSCPASSRPEPLTVDRCRGHLQRGREEDPKWLWHPGGLYLRREVEEKGTPEPALGFQGQGSSDAVTLHLKLSKVRKQ